MKLPLITAAALVLILASVNSDAVTVYGMSYGSGVVKGVQIAADYVDCNAPNWATNYAEKSDAEFMLIAMKQTYITGSMGESRSESGQEDGVSARIQAYIDEMNSVGEPVWFTGTASEPVPASVSPRLTPATHVNRRARIPLRPPA